MWKIGKMIGDREGRMDACLAAAGIMCDPNDTLYMSEKTLQKVRFLYSFHFKIY